MQAYRNGMRRSFVAAAIFIGIASSSARASVFLDNRLGGLPAASRVAVAAPQPARLVFTFQTNGLPYDRATEFLQSTVAAEVEASGVVSTLGGPSAAGAVLNVTVNNIPQKGAVAKGLLAGATFFLAGTVVTDAYLTTVEYRPAGSTVAISRSVEHAIYTKIGIKPDPQHADKVRTDAVALKTMVRQSLAHALNAIAADPRFAAPTTLASAPVD